MRADRLAAQFSRPFIQSPECSLTCLPWDATWIESDEPDDAAACPPWRRLLADIDAEAVNCAGFARVDLPTSAPRGWLEPDLRPPGAQNATRTYPRASLPTLMMIGTRLESNRRCDCPVTLWYELGA